MRPFAGQLQHRRTADIAPRSGDQCDLPFELAHAPITPTIFTSASASRRRLCSTMFQNRALAASLEANSVPGLGRRAGSMRQNPSAAFDGTSPAHALQAAP